MAGERALCGLGITTTVIALGLFLLGATVPADRHCLLAHCVEPTWADASFERDGDGVSAERGLDLTLPSVWLHHRAQLSPFPFTTLSWRETLAFQTARDTLARRTQQGIARRAFWSGMAPVVLVLGLVVSAAGLRAIRVARRRRERTSIRFTTRPGPFLAWSTLALLVFTFGGAVQLLRSDLGARPPPCDRIRCLTTNWPAASTQGPIGRPDVAPDVDLRNPRTWRALLPVIPRDSSPSLTPVERRAWRTAADELVEQRQTDRSSWSRWATLHTGLGYAVGGATLLAILGLLVLFRRRRLPRDRWVVVTEAHLHLDDVCIPLDQVVPADVVRILETWRSEGFRGDPAPILEAVDLNRRMLASSSVDSAIDRWSFTFSPRPDPKRILGLRISLVVCAFASGLVMIAVIEPGRPPWPLDCADGGCVSTAPPETFDERLRWARARRARWTLRARIVDHTRGIAPWSALAAVLGTLGVLALRRQPQALQVDVEQHALVVDGVRRAWEEVDPSDPLPDRGPRTHDGPWEALMGQIAVRTVHGVAPHVPSALRELRSTVDT